MYESFTYGGGEITTRRPQTPMKAYESGVPSVNINYFYGAILLGVVHVNCR